VSHISARRITRSAGAAAFAVSVSLSVPAFAKPQHLGDRVLKQGMSGQDVRALQASLTSAGFPTPVKGVFDRTTVRSVRSFERSYHLRVDGVATAVLVHELRKVLAKRSATVASADATKARSGGASAGGTSVTASTKTTARISDSSGHRYPGDSQHMGDRILRQGMSGHDVRVLQDFLTRAGFPTTVDGQFGSGTRSNVIAFQQAHQLRPNGVVTYSVNQVLRAAIASAQTSVQSTGPVSKARLNSNGTATAPANAPASVKAVIAAANRIAFKPYIYGGGHASWDDSGYDCSGSVSYALHGGHLISSPEDSTELESYGSPGAGRWITIWANSGHTYMYVAGLRFDTSAQGSTGGSRWTSERRSSGGYVERHPSGL
jgi:peptidoglycan hydrolase-like protein with peptidoglycan-binding domain